MNCGFNISCCDCVAPVLRLSSWGYQPLASASPRWDFYWCMMCQWTHPPSQHRAEPATTCVSNQNPPCAPLLKFSLDHVAEFLFFGWCLTSGVNLCQKHENMLVYWLHCWQPVILYWSTLLLLLLLILFVFSLTLLLKQLLKSFF